MGKGRIKKAINKFKSGVKSGSASVPAKNQTSNSGYSIGAYSNKPSTSKLQSSKGFYPTPTGKAPVAQSKYSIGGMKNATQSSYLTNLSTQKKTTFPVKPATTFGGQSPVPGKPVGGQTKVPLNYTPVPGVSGPQTLVPTNTGGSSGGSSSQFGSSTIGTPAQVNGPVDAVDTAVVDKGATQTFSGGGETATARTGTTTARTGTTTAPAGSTATSGATTTGSGITLAPAGSEGYLGGYDYSLSNEERAQQQAYEEEQAYYEKQKNERVDRNQIMRDALRQFQGEIDATNSVYADKLKQTQLAGLDRLGMSRAENFNAGAVNSSFGNAALERVGAYNRDAEGAVNNEKLQLISSIESAARAAGDKYYQEKKAAKEAGLEAYMASLGNAKTAKQAISADIANNMISSGVDFDSISPAQLEKIAKGAGVAVRSIKEEYDKSKLEADKGKIAASRENTIASLYNQGVTDPYQILNYVNYDDNGNQTGDITLDEITKVLDAQGEGFDLSEGQARYDARGNLIASRGKTYAPSSGGGGMNLTPGQINTTVNGIASAFDNEPIVKAYNTVQEGFQTINSIGVNTSSPADDIAFIYAFAKIMDPNSVVREGEYNTIQKYAQTWADNFGFKAKRIFKNSNFLTADAKQKMLNALKPKVDTVSSQYQNVYNEYQRQVQGAYTGQQRSITDYSGAYTQPAPTTSTPGKFDNIASSITIDGTNAYLPRSVWATVEDKDGLLAEAAADGYTLLIN